MPSAPRVTQRPTGIAAGDGRPSTPLRPLPSLVTALLTSLVTAGPTTLTFRNTGRLSGKVRLDGKACAAYALHDTVLGPLSGGTPLAA